MWMTLIDCIPIDKQKFISIIDFPNGFNENTI